MGDDGIEWELEDLDGGVLYDVFYESTTMLAGRMLAGLATVCWTGS